MSPRATTVSPGFPAPPCIRRVHCIPAYCTRATGVKSKYCNLAEEGSQVTSQGTQPKFSIFHTNLKNMFSRTAAAWNILRPGGFDKNGAGLIKDNPSIGISQHGSSSPETETDGFGSIPGLRLIQGEPVYLLKNLLYWLKTRIQSINRRHRTIYPLSNLFKLSFNNYSFV